METSDLREEMLSNPSAEKITWTEKKPDFQLFGLQELIETFGFIESIRLLSFNSVYPVVIISRYIKKKIHRHLIQRKIEMGGVLLGKVFRVSGFHGDNLICYVTNSIASTQYESTSVSLRIGTEVWSEAYKQIDKGNIVIGWYHSHPNLGAFFSSTDRHTQKHFFIQPFHLGLVVDPWRQEEKFFSGRDSTEVSHVLTKG